MQKKKIKKSKAAVLAVTMIILGLVLVIGLGASVISIMSNKASVSSNKSNLAYSRADSGVEDILLRIKNAGTGDRISEIVSCNNGIFNNSSEGYKIEFKNSSDELITDCETRVTQIRGIKSTGKADDNQRVIEVAVADPGFEPDSDLMILMDFSRSMDKNEIKKEKNAVIDLINNLGPEYRVGIVAFSESKATRKTFSLVPITQKNDLINFINNKLSNQGSGGTHISSAINWATEELLEGANSRHDTNPQAIILITDGAPRENTRDDDYSIFCGGEAWDRGGAKNCLKESSLAKDEGINIFSISIGFNNYNSKCLAKVNELMSKIASSSEQYFSIDDINKLKDLLDGLRPAS